MWQISGGTKINGGGGGRVETNLFFSGIIALYKQ